LVDCLAIDFYKEYKEGEHINIGNDRYIVENFRGKYNEKKGLKNKKRSKEARIDSANSSMDMMKNTVEFEEYWKNR
jgi:hypothetical protein